MGQFSLKRLFLSVASIAAAFGMFLFMMSRKVNPRANPGEWREPPRFDLLGMLLWILSGAIVLATLFSFAKRSWLWTAYGAILGALLMLALKRVLLPPSVYGGI